MEKSPEKLRVKNVETFDQFLLNWVEGFDRVKRGTSAPESWWEGAAAYLELRSADDDFIIEATKSDYFERIYLEIENYRKFAPTISERAAAYEDAIALLTKIEGKFKFEGKRTPASADLKGFWPSALP